MYPEDRVLVGVITRRRDLLRVRDERWYRIPAARLPRGGLYASYIAFFIGGALADGRGSGIHYYARRTGFELVRRRDLLPEEPDHIRADDVYYKLQLGDLCARVPPIGNAARRRVTFILTTWECFVNASEVSELYGAVDRLDLSPRRFGK